VEGGGKPPHSEGYRIRYARCAMTEVGRLIKLMAR